MKPDLKISQLANFKMNIGCNSISILFSIFFLLSPLLWRGVGGEAFAQSKKDVKENDIKSSTENTTVVENGKETFYKDTYTAFDKSGNMIEEIIYNPDGTVKKRHTMKYDKLSGKNKMEEVEYEGKDGLIISKKHTWTYNLDNDKTQELTYDGSGKLIRKEIYTYSNKGLKVEKKIYDGNNVLLETHKFSYKM